MNTNYPRLILAGAHSRAGKTTITMGLILALKNRGLAVQAFKAGPDYIDPSYHTLASGRACRNLDTWMLSQDAVLELFERQARACDISVIEGVMGLYDGLREGEEGSTAHLAKILDAPVILIVDAHSMSRSAGAVVLGYKEFDKGVGLKGVILNNIGSAAHYNSVRGVIETSTGLPVLGFLSRDKSLTLPERHLGLIPTAESTSLGVYAEKLSAIVAKNMDIDRIIEIAKAAEPLPDFKKEIFAQASAQGTATIAVARDEAFNFYYQDSLDILEHYGARLVEFSPVRDKSLPPEADGVYIGGGFPELFAKDLSQNIELKKDIYAKAASGMPVYAECGGLMYLVKELSDFEGRDFPMVGIFDASVRMGDRLAALGYADIEMVEDNILSRKGAKARAHLFHWSRLDNLSEKERRAYKVTKNGKSLADGLVKWNTLASYSHIHFGSNTGFAKNFIRSCHDAKEAACEIRHNAG